MSSYGNNKPAFIGIILWTASSSLSLPKTNVSAETLQPQGSKEEKSTQNHHTTKIGPEAHNLSPELAHDSLTFPPPTLIEMGLPWRSPLSPAAHPGHQQYRTRAGGLDRMAARNPIS